MVQTKFDISSIQWVRKKQLCLIFFPLVMKSSERSAKLERAMCCLSTSHDVWELKLKLSSINCVAHLSVPAQWTCNKFYPSTVGLISTWTIMWLYSWHIASVRLHWFAMYFFVSYCFPVSKISISENPFLLYLCYLGYCSLPYTSIASYQVLSNS